MKNDTSVLSLPTVTSGTSSRIILPLPVICPITKELLSDPVVGPDGISHERSILLGQHLPSQQQQGDVDDPASTVHTTDTTSSTIENDNNNGTVLSGGGGDDHDAYDEEQVYRKNSEVLVLETRPQDNLKTLDRNKSSMENDTSGGLSLSTVRSDSHIIIPLPIICPITQELLSDPVVGPDGISYERSILLGQQLPSQQLKQEQEQGRVDDPGPVPTNDTTSPTANNDNSGTVNRPMPSNGLRPHEVYPNRALLRLMEECLGLTEDTWKAGIRRARHKEASTPGCDGLALSFTLPHDQPIPESYICPITLDLFHYPVIDPEGNTFEQEAIVTWIRTHGVSPLSRTQLSIHDLYPNYAIRQLMEYHAAGGEDDVNERNEEEEDIAMDEEEEGKDSSSVTDEEGNETKVQQRKIHPALVKWKADIASTGTEWPPLQSDPTGTNHDATSTTGNIPPDVYNASSPQEVQLPPHLYPMTMEDLELYRRHQRWLLARVVLYAGLCVLGCAGGLVWTIMRGGDYFVLLVAIWLGYMSRDFLDRYKELRTEENAQLEAAERRIQQNQERTDQLRARLAELARSLALGGGGGGGEEEEEEPPTQPTPSSTNESNIDIETGQLPQQLRAEAEALIRQLHLKRVSELKRRHVERVTELKRRHVERVTALKRLQQCERP